MMMVFQSIGSTEHSELKALVMPELEDKRSLERVLKDNTDLVKSASRAGKANPANNSLADLQDDVQDALRELAEDTENTHADEERNMKYFDTKFALQKQQIIEEMERVIVRESDRVISELKSGPHDRLVDKVRYRHFKQNARSY